MSKPKLPVGTIVELTSEATKWKAEHADEMTGFPKAFLNLNPRSEWHDQVYDLQSYLMERYSHQYGLKIHGIIVGDNDYDDECFAYLVWEANQIGEDIEWLCPEDFEVID